jgi:small nuclear ribonucleoprotein G
MDKQLFVHLQAGRKVVGKLRGYDVFLNIVLDDAVDETDASDKQSIGNVVRLTFISIILHGC